MNDNELLELAAKAAGAAPRFPPKGRERIVDTNYWNPLTDDGDALRLAVKIGQLDYLGIEIQTGLVQVDALKPFENCEYEEFKSNEDPYAATRRAIVRAAAEIGKEMK